MRRSLVQAAKHQGTQQHGPANLMTKVLGNSCATIPNWNKGCDSCLLPVSIVGWRPGPVRNGGMQLAPLQEQLLPPCTSDCSMPGGGANSVCAANAHILTT